MIESEKDCLDAHPPLSQNACWVMLPHYDLNKHKLLPPNNVSNRLRRDEKTRKNVQKEREPVIVDMGVFLFRFVWKCFPVWVC